MAEIPRLKGLDHTLPLMREGYPYLMNRCRQLKSEIFRFRFFGQSAICLHGEEGAALFYDESKFIRKGVTPRRLKETLLGKGGIHGLDDEAHRHRKAAFMSLMTPEHIQWLVVLMSAQWKAYCLKWTTAGQVNLFQEVQEILCRAICTWSGVPLEKQEVKQRTQDFAAMIEAFGGVGLRNVRGRAARKRTEKWLAKLITDIRAEKFKVNEDTAAYTMAWHRDLKGELLDLEVAVAELINVLRPTVAIAYYVVFIALALHQHPEYRKRLQAQEDKLTEFFSQEVRRYYPFAPFMGARTRQDFTWKEYRFPMGQLVLLDIYGTNHDAMLWPQPESFWPERYHHWPGSPFDFIPQGGGDHFNGHRCPGEWITIEAMKLGLNVLVNGITYEVPPQDLSFSLARMPTYPKSGFIIQNVKLWE
ncbi:cytochrome P450 [Adhaeribacter soli]|uniref:Cytochrome P450 n=1 Tax=Adhaeribacter soli TaxID=2607655 RepID=A0A5N1JA24_9BACT|nr:cytochrome P450 [Adhaeribacter soli]KAA9346165.1 cytochrome P450 [Adhaeribacter soli]